MIAPKPLLTLRPEDIKPYNPLPEQWTESDIPTLYRLTEGKVCECPLCQPDRLDLDVAFVVVLLGYVMWAALIVAGAGVLAWLGNWAYGLL